MGEIRSKTCEQGRDRRNQLVTHVLKVSLRYLNDGKTQTHGDFWASGTYDDELVRFTSHGPDDIGSADRMWDAR